MKNFTWNISFSRDVSEKERLQISWLENQIQEISNLQSNLKGFSYDVCLNLEFVHDWNGAANVVYLYSDYIYTAFVISKYWIDQLHFNWQIASIIGYNLLVIMLNGFALVQT